MNSLFNRQRAAYWILKWQKSNGDGNGTTLLASDFDFDDDWKVRYFMFTLKWKRFENKTTIDEMVNVIQQLKNDVEEIEVN